ncbi:hypothetical protein K402DRAFT_122664 [Aulographum hederae CBS 113979]|uniref:Uncharacterized protein n=1 Tax=Aulographum hederae CBS 113979 TaxID=1176131 RepID=A0A6G1GW37_9PEZI|nr:hypothetical protein K402DRAFT_122664 [Aulographum hederae CBS 113979]
MSWSKPYRLKIISGPRLCLLLAESSWLAESTTGPDSSLTVETHGRRPERIDNCHRHSCSAFQSPNIIDMSLLELHNSHVESSQPSIRRTRPSTAAFHVESCWHGVQVL